MPRFEPFRGLRYRRADTTDVTAVTSPPYDVFDEATRDDYARTDAHNIVLVDYPVERDGPDRYRRAAERLHEWTTDGVMVRDDRPTFYIYRMRFTDEVGVTRESVGVVGGLEVTDEGSGGVLPHERTTPKAKTDRLDLTRATRSNLSPVWGLSLSRGLSGLLADPATEVARCIDEHGVLHVLERIDDDSRLAIIETTVASQPVLIADGHHRYAIARTYRDECRAHGATDAADLTMTFVQELVEEQLNIAAIHRLVDAAHQDVLAVLGAFYETVGVETVTPRTLVTMGALDAICVVDSAGEGTLLTPREGVFDDVRDMDSVRLERALGDMIARVSYQHGVSDVLEALRSGRAGTAVLIRPVGIAEIRRTADTGELMPPKSTFFAPKLRTGLVIRPLD